MVLCRALKTGMGINQTGKTMKYRLTTLTALALTTTSAYGGGLDRSGQSVAALCEAGGYAELSYGLIMPMVSGVFSGVVS